MIEKNLEGGEMAANSNLINFGTPFIYTHVHVYIYIYSPSYRIFEIIDASITFSRFEFLADNYILIAGGIELVEASGGKYYV